MNTSNTVYIGTYTSSAGKGIYICEYDSTRGILLQKSVCEIENPSYVITSLDKRFAYAVIECRNYMGQKGGGVAAFRINQDSGALTFMNSCPTLGEDPCHLCVDRANTRLSVANYSGGAVSSFLLGSDGSIIPPASVTEHNGSSKDKLRQEAAHVHFVGFTPDEELLYAVDLGLDRVLFYKPESRQDGFFLRDDETALIFEPGSGPRHLVYGKTNLIYAITELTSQVSVFNLRRGEASRPIQTLSLLPAGFSGQSYASAVKISHNGRFLCAANRGHDSISVYRIEKNGLLQLAGCFPSGGKYPRDIAFSHNGNFLFAANQNSDSVTVLQFDSRTGALSPPQQILKLPKPVCLNTMF